MRSSLLALALLGAVAPPPGPAPLPQDPAAHVQPVYAVDYKVSRKTGKDEVVLLSGTAYVVAGHVTTFEAKEGHTSQAVELKLEVEYRDDHRIAVQAKWSEVSHEGDHIDWHPQLQVHQLGEPTAARVSWGNDSRILTLTLR